MKPSDIERLIHICAKLNVNHIRLKSGEVELALEFTNNGNVTSAIDKAKKYEEWQRQQIATLDNTRKTLDDALREDWARRERERQGKQPGTYMSDIDLAMNPPRDLREAMDAAPLDIVVPGEPGIKVTEKEVEPVGPDSFPGTDYPEPL